MKLTYKQRLSLWFVVIFTIFTVGVVVLEQSRERVHKTLALEEKLDSYADMADVALAHGGDSQMTLDSLLMLFPANIRLTLVDKQGAVGYDNTAQISENHASRPEIISAKESGKGTAIRVSSSVGREYLYYAKRFGDHFIRVALPYDIKIQHFLKADNLFLYYIVAFFVIMLFFINYIAGRFSQSIDQLRDFTSAAQNGGDLSKMDFPDDELGEIGARIADNYNRLRENEKQIALEREKLLQHILSSEEGICFYAYDRKVGFHNGLFIQYLNIIVDHADGDPASVFSDPSFERVVSFISDHSRSESYMETTITRQGKHFAVRVNIFEDNGFEIIINDITRSEKTRLLKQEMTGNIAHELRTPVTTIRGYLETLLGKELDSDKQRLFLEKAHNGTIVLSELIQDMGLITKMEDAPQSFTLERVGIAELLLSLQNDLDAPMREKGIRMESDITNEIVVNGNRSLIYSVFRNLTENVMRHAGDNVTIRVDKYNEDRDFYYFSFSDDGVGIVDEQHLSRLFERFYRVGEGRTRDSGGSGLGLSIVKNAILFHKGTIDVKNLPEGGLQFLFKLPRTSH